MTAWLAVGLVGAGSYGFRLVPLLLADRWTPGPRLEAGLRHAGIAALAAIAATSVRAPSLTGDAASAVATAAAIGVGAVAARRRWPMVALVAAGAAAHLGTTLLLGGLS
jgi:branched-subunit amino acid transport protein